MQSAGRTGSPPISDGAGLVADPKAALASSTRSIQGKPGTVAEDIAASSPASAQSRIASNDGLLLEQPIHISPSHSNNVAHNKAAADLLGSEQNTGAGKVEARVKYGSTNNIPVSGLVQSGRSKVGIPPKNAGARHAMARKDFLDNLRRKGFFAGVNEGRLRMKTNYSAPSICLNWNMDGDYRICQEQQIDQ